METLQHKQIGFMLSQFHCSTATTAEAMNGRDFPYPLFEEVSTDWYEYKQRYASIYAVAAVL